MPGSEPVTGYRSARPEDYIPALVYKVIKGMNAGKSQQGGDEANKAPAPYWKASIGEGCSGGNAQCSHG
jgi:hypothetical protein